MADRQFRSQFQQSFSAQPVSLTPSISFGATGAPTLAAGVSGIKSVVRNSAGKYTITLSDRYNSLKAMSLMQLAGSVSAAAPIVTIVSQAVNAATPTIVIQYRAIDNSTATDPASGEQALIQILLNNSSV